MKITALYERLSRDDEHQGESVSIVNQKEYLEDFARSKGFRNIHHFADDGYTGTNFNRPGFNSLLKEINAGNVEVLCVSDMSRIGRNYLQVGFYTEILFPEKGVRFIAVNNGIDSDKPTENEFTPFLNVINEWYAKETSKKIKAIVQNRMQSGLRHTAEVPYGYYVNPDDKQRLCVDQAASGVIQRIFSMAVHGYSITEIAQTLREEKILIPAAYRDQLGVKIGNCRYHDPYYWNTTTIKEIIGRQEYLGHTVLGKTGKDAFKAKHRTKQPPDKWLVFPNTHEPIIDQDTWDLANKLTNKTSKRSEPRTYSHRLSGLVFCADCGARMGYRRPANNKIAAGKAKESEGDFQCGNYRNPFHGCPNHHISAANLEAAILQAVQAVSEFVLQDEDQFIRQLMEKWELTRKNTADDSRKEVLLLRKRLSELDNLIQGLYESQIKGLVSERQAQELFIQYDEEQLQLEGRITEIERQEEYTVPKKNDINRFITLVKKYQTVTELTDSMLYEYIDKVMVHAPTGGQTPYRQQQIDVYFRFIGYYQIPAPVMSEEERIALIDAEIEAKRSVRQKRNSEHNKEKLINLKKKAKTDPEAAEELNKYYELRRQASKGNREKSKAEREADPGYQAQKEANKAKQEQKKLENRWKTMPISGLTELAKTDPIEAEHLKIRREKAAEKNRKAKQRRLERMAQDPEYAAIRKEKEAELIIKSTAKHKAFLEDLAERAKSDPEAAAELQEIRDRQRSTSKRYYERKKTRMETDPEYAEIERAKQKENNKKRYAQWKSEHDELVERAKTDPIAAEALLAQKAAASQATMKSRRKLVEKAKTDPDAAYQLQTRRERMNSWARNYRAELKTMAKTDQEAAAKLAKMKAKQKEYSLRYMENMREKAKADPEVATKLEERHQYQLEYGKNWRKRKKELLSEGDSTD